MVEVEILGVSDTPNHPVVLLRHEDRVLPIVVGIPEAQAIYVGLRGVEWSGARKDGWDCNPLAGISAALD